MMSLTGHLIEPVVPGNLVVWSALHVYTCKNLIKIMTISTTMMDLINLVITTATVMVTLIIMTTLIIILVTRWIPKMQPF